MHFLGKNKKLGEIKGMKKRNLYKLLLTAILTVFVLGACSSNSDSTDATKEEKKESTVQETSTEVSKENPIYVNEEEKTVQVYATVNGKYLVTPTRHGLNWVEGKYGNQAVLTAYADPLLFNEALTKLGGTPAVEKGGDASQEFEVTDEGKFIKGDEVKVSITWEDAEKEYDIAEVMVDSTGKSLEYHFGGNYDAAAKMVTGCYMCFDSCPVGIISNASHPTGTFESGNAEFHGNPDVLPEDGTPVVLTYSFGA
jgi:FlaG/FlaF family flagellin (archaellin)